MLTNKTFLLGVGAGVLLCYGYHHFGMPGAKHGATRAAAG